MVAKGKKQQKKIKNEIEIKRLPYITLLISCLAIFAFAAFLFTPFRIILLGNVRRLWIALGIFCQSQWDAFLDVVGDDFKTLWIYGSTILTVGLYWILGSIYTIFDVTNKPEAIRRYKIQPGKNEPVNTKRLFKVIFVALFNQMIAYVLIHLNYGIVELRGFPSVRELPQLHIILIQLPLLMAIQEIGFYYSHRLLHYKQFYQYIHKIHHQWTAPIAIAAIYCHPLEHIISNVFPPFLGVLILGPHLLTAWIWFSIAIYVTLAHHSGYHLPFLPSPEFHDYHHLKFNQNFGVTGHLDWLHGTDGNFRKTVGFVRHVILFGLMPARQLIPDTSKNN